MKLNEFAKSNAEWIVRGVLLLLLMANLWLTSNFLRIADFSKFVDSQDAIHKDFAKALNSIEITLRELTNVQNSLKDHEERIRVVERRQENIGARLSNVEATNGRGAR